MKKKIETEYKRTLSLGCYPIPIHVWIAKDVQESWKKFEKEFKVEGFDGNFDAGAFTKGIKNDCVPIFFRSTNNIEVITHECAHAIDFAFMDLGVEHHFDNSEAYAYPLGYLVGLVCKMFDDMKKKKKR